VTEKKRTTKSTLLDTLETQVLEVLKNKDITTAERLKAIETGAKILSIRHKLDGEGHGEGSFFGSSAAK